MATKPVAKRRPDEYAFALLGYGGTLQQPHMRRVVPDKVARHTEVRYLAVGGAVTGILKARTRVEGEAFRCAHGAYG